MTHQDVPAPMGERDESYTHIGMGIRAGFRPEKKAWIEMEMERKRRSDFFFSLLGFSVIALLVVLVHSCAVLPQVVSR